MTKVELINAVAAQTGLKKKDAEAAVSCVFETIQNTLANGEKVQIVGFGTFDVKERAERQGRNPFSGEVITIAASKHTVFSSGKALKAAVK